MKKKTGKPKKMRLKLIKSVTKKKKNGKQKSYKKVKEIEIISLLFPVGITIFNVFFFEFSKLSTIIPKRPIYRH